MLWRAYSARLRRRINSSVLPENMEPVITVKDPTGKVDASAA
jgi:hypothetical protein